MKPILTDGKKQELQKHKAINEQRSDAFPLQQEQNVPGSICRGAKASDYPA